MAPVTQSSPEDKPAAVDSTSSNKLRKLMVEKVRRDRINHSIEQLRALLDPAAPPGGRSPSRLEKADVLELAVGLLKRRALARAAPSYSQGFSQCLQETLRHLSLHAPLQPAEREEIKRFYVLQRAALQRHVCGEQRRRSGARKRDQSCLWRPW
ncbi:transcription factor HES-5-like [Cheilinus undulatus]|uniref:transcription factor HES-5-like n=1 Tax=Cheilinus undulatus TaxID=241271 RepID=UPI001BD4BFEF|nr:transcription factor HES-5-like [Cheilinus undulatus]